MDAVVLAGGVPAPGELLYEETQGQHKAMLDIAGKPMVQWVLDALSAAQQVEQVVVVGLTASSGLTCGKPITFIPDQSGMLQNMRAGAQEVRRLNPQADYVLFVSGDIPAITGEMVDWVVETAMQTNLDIYYNVIKRETMEARFPGSNRTYTRLKDMEVCGGDMNIGRINLLLDREGPWEALIRRRKNPLAQAALIGFDTLFLLLMRQLTLDSAIERVTKRLGLTGRALVCPYAEVGMDVDKPYQLTLMRDYMASRQAE